VAEFAASTANVQ